MGPASGRARRVGGLLAVLVGELCACGDVSKKLEEANEARHAGRPRDALAGYRAVLAELGEGKLPAARDAARLRALRYAADVSYLELGDFQGAVSYYRRVVALHPGTPEAWKARAMIGDIYRDRFNDRQAAIAQYADIAASESPDAPAFQLRVAREYLELRNWEQARTEARALREKWPRSDLADEAQLLNAQAWALEKRGEEALRAFAALLERKPRPEIEARALEGQAHLYAQMGAGRSCGASSCLDKALELYARALASHPNPEAIRMNVAAVRKRRDAARTVKPGDRDAALDHRVRRKDEESP